MKKAYIIPNTLISVVQINTYMQNVSLDKTNEITNSNAILGKGRDCYDDESGTRDTQNGWSDGLW